ncbi:mechanosensitive ion channel protein MscL [Candidatus Kaiserbacteria bacterium RIFOXYD1_FULL_42_15]|uniref:Large-conductance mechanosensitive channel n=1 Tax=Candidatus Kaiserbacteria bacterium RIFOXYD1_FULL_42_15 TaxID=1798532 RepID=A0A1F6FTH2_9BACT|nr:MAG: mechanosensitive ion channel protein MscL [Candidatus Kaiserbacteria bacterium RIFOXYD1_FULL_42_15]
MKIFIEEFKAFAMKGNVIELAVAVVIGTAFGKIVSSLVTNIITPFLGILLGGIDFSNLQLIVGDTAITYGVFIQSIVDFVIISLVIFLAIKAVSRLHEKEEAKLVAEKIVEPSTEVKLLTEIRDSLSR